MAELVKDRALDRAEAKPKNAVIEVVQAMHKLSLEEKAILLEYLARALQCGIRRETVKDVTWDEFIDMTYGSLADDPIELPERFKARERETME